MFICDKLNVKWMNLRYNDLRCQSRNSIIGVNWFNLYLLFILHVSTLIGSSTGKINYTLPEDDPIRVETCSINNKYKLNQSIPIIELRDWHLRSLYLPRNVTLTYNLRYFKIVSCHLFNTMTSLTWVFAHFRFLSTCTISWLSHRPVS
jgi:hypothetical protein